MRVPRFTIATRRGSAVEALFADLLTCLEHLYKIVPVGCVAGQVIVADTRPIYARVWWLITDNGGELNVIKVNGGVWMGRAPGESIAYEHGGALTDGSTLAYRVLEYIDGDTIDYTRRETELLETARDMAARAPGLPREPRRSRAYSRVSHLLRGTTSDGLSFPVSPTASNAMRNVVREEPHGGVTSLATSELIARLTGAKLEHAENLMLGFTIRDLPANANKYLSKTQCEKLDALLEFSKRYKAAEVEERAPLRNPRDVWARFAPHMEDLPHEEFHVAILDAQHKLKRDEMITKGILNSSMVHPREVFARAITERAAAIILVHNHPSGDPTPSADDRAITAQLVAAGRLLDIPVADHVVIGRGRYLSFAEGGLL